MPFFEPESEIFETVLTDTGIEGGIVIRNTHFVAQLEKVPGAECFHCVDIFHTCGGGIECGRVVGASFSCQIFFIVCFLPLGNILIGMENIGTAPVAADFDGRIFQQLKERLFCAAAGIMEIEPEFPEKFPIFRIKIFGETIAACPQEICKIFCGMEYVGEIEFDPFAIDDLFSIG